MRKSNEFEGEGGQKRTILEFGNVYKYYGPEVPALRGVSFSVERGEFLYITGPSGAGKSTLLRLVYRGDQPDQGRVYFCGRDITRLRADSVPFLRRNLGVVFQDFKVLLHRTAFENVALALEVLGTAPRAIRRRVFDALDQVGLQRRAYERVGKLSGGEQQRVAIARAIVTEPDLLLADEPTGNLDPELSRSILQLFERIHRDGTTVVVATHDRSLLLDHPHRVVALADGRATDLDAVDFGWMPAPQPHERPGRPRSDESPWAPITIPRDDVRPTSPPDDPPMALADMLADADSPGSVERPSPLLAEAAMRDPERPSLCVAVSDDEDVALFANAGLGDGSYWDETPEEILRSILS